MADRAKSYTDNFETYSYSYIDASHTTKADSQGNITTLSFADSGLIADHIPPAADGAGATHKDYDTNGNVTRSIDEVGVKTDFTYDLAGRVTSVTRDATGATPVRFEYTYDPAFPDKVTAVTPKSPASGSFDPNWQGWKYDYYQTGPAAPGSLKHVYRLRSDGSSTDTISTFQYDAKGRVTQQTTGDGRRHGLRLLGRRPLHRHATL